MAADTAELYEPVAEEKGQTLTFTPPPASAASGGAAAIVRGDRHLLSQAAANLVDNAIKYTPAGGRIDVAVSVAGTGARLTVGDSGPGIPPKFRAAVLDRFFPPWSRADTPPAPAWGSALSLPSPTCTGPGSTWATTAPACVWT